MKEIFLLKLGEIVLKGANKRQFESRLRQNVRRRMKAYGNFDVYLMQSTLYVEPLDDECDVDGARTIQHQRFGSDGRMCNARMGPEEMRRFCQLSEESAELMKNAFEAMGLTARSYDRILKVARTVADLDGSKDIEPRHIAEAIQYRAVNLGNR